MTEQLDLLVGLARDHRVALVSPGAVDVSARPLGFCAGSLTRDPDGHGIRFVSR